MATDVSSLRHEDFEQLASEYNADVAAGQQRVRMLYPLCDSTKFPLPTSLSKTDKSQVLEVTNGGLRVIYTGPGKQPKEAASVRANFSIPPFCGIFYFEVQVKNVHNGCMGIGLSDKSVQLERLPGWDPNSYGYHGDDGHFFSANPQGVPYGPTFGTDDVVGCGLNLVERTLFFTKNGEMLGTACALDRTHGLYPALGMQNAGETVDINFGQKPFLYDLATAMIALRDKVNDNVLHTQLPPEKTRWMHCAIMSWLLVQGHSRTLSALSAETKQEPDHDEHAIAVRNEVRSLIVKGRAGEAAQKIEALYPQFFQKHTHEAILLKSQQFVEMSLEFLKDPEESSSVPIGLSRSTSSLRSHQHSGVSRAQKRPPPLDEGPSCSRDRDFHQPPARRSPLPIDGIRDERMDLEEETQNGHAKNGAQKEKNGTARKRTATVIEQESRESGEAEDSGLDMDRVGYSAIHAHEYEKFRPALEFGRALHKLYLECTDLPSELKAIANESMASICISNLSELLAHPQLTEKHRKYVATEVNAAMISEEGGVPHSVLDRHFLTCREMKQEMYDLQIPSGVFVDVNRLILGTPAIEVGGSSSFRSEQGRSSDMEHSGEELDHESVEGERNRDRDQTPVASERVERSRQENMNMDTA